MQSWSSVVKRAVSLTWASADIHVRYHLLFCCDDHDWTVLVLKDHALAQASAECWISSVGIKITPRRWNSNMVSYSKTKCFSFREAEYSTFNTQFCFTCWKSLHLEVLNRLEKINKETNKSPIKQLDFEWTKSNLHLPGVSCILLHSYRHFIQGQVVHLNKNKHVLQIFNSWKIFFLQRTKQICSSWCSEQD